MKHAVVICHPRMQAFTRLTARTYIEAVQARGDEVVVRDLYAMDFDPRLHADELPDAAGGHVRTEILIERAILKDVDVFAFFYPIWFGSPPAMLKGYVERVFGVGFGYGAIKSGGTGPLLSGRSMVSFTSTGSENLWLVDSGGWDAVRKVFNERLSSACGLQSLDHVNFGGVDADMAPARIDEAVQQVRQAVTDLFPAPPPRARRRAPAS
ncbi:MAG: NAD(P)H-dependent oxidoreductase [Caulobacteraceae bacterium]|nr:NAD(P)H-dependent oxidoreductase [Caulobacteraceae bacterium]